MISNNKQALIKVAWSVALTVLCWLILVLGIALVTAGYAGSLQAVATILYSGLGAPSAFLASICVAGYTYLSNAKLTAAVAANFLKPDTVTTTKARIQDPDEIERLFAELVSVVDKQLIIAIDDIDRLPPDRMISALNVVHDFQAACGRNQHPPVFIVSCDDKIVRDALVAYTVPVETVPPGLVTPYVAQNDAEKSAQAYLDRYFTQRIRMPPHSATDLRSFALAALERNNHVAQEILGGEVAATVEVLIHDGVANPRHAIRLLNAFFADLRLARRREGSSSRRSIRAGEVTGRPRVLARMTVLQVDFQDAYAEIQVDPSLVGALVSYVRNEADEAEKGLVNDLVSRMDRRAREADDAGHSSRQRPSTRLLAYLSRTASWVDDVESLTPFIDLGQDHIERQLGSDAATKYRRRVVNADLRTLIPELEHLVADHSAQQSLASLVELFVVLLRNASGVELDNTIKSVDAVLPLLAEDSKAVLADEVGAALARADVGAELTRNSVALVPHSRDARARSWIMHVLTRAGDVGPTNARALAVYDAWQALTEALHSDSVLARFTASTLELIGSRGSIEDLRPWMERLIEPRNQDDHEAARLVILAQLRLVEDHEDESSLPSDDDVTTLLKLAEQAGLPSRDVSEAVDRLLDELGVDGAIGRLLSGLATVSSSASAPNPAVHRIVGLLILDDGESLVDDAQAETIVHAGTAAIRETLHELAPADVAALDRFASVLLRLCQKGNTVAGAVTELDPAAAGDYGMELMASLAASYASHLELSPAVCIEAWREERSKDSGAEWWLSSFEKFLDSLQEDVAAEVVVAVCESVDGKARSTESVQAIALLLAMSSSRRGRTALERCMSTAQNNLEPSLDVGIVAMAVDLLVQGSPLVTSSTDDESALLRSLGNLLRTETARRVEGVRGLIEFDWAPESRCQLLEVAAPSASTIEPDDLLRLIDSVRSTVDHVQVAPIPVDGAVALVRQVLLELNDQQFSFLLRHVPIEARAVLAAHSGTSNDLQDYLNEIDSELVEAEAKAWCAAILTEAADSLPSGAGAVAEALREHPTAIRAAAEEFSADSLDGLVELPPHEFWAFLSECLDLESLSIVVSQVLSRMEDGYDKMLLACEILLGFIKSPSNGAAVERRLIEERLAERLSRALDPMSDLDEGQANDLIDALAAVLTQRAELKQDAVRQLGRRPGRGEAHRELWDKAKSALRG